MKDSYKNLDVDGKFARVLHKLSNFRPFYCAVYEALERVESESIDTIGVTTNKIVYNKEFVNSPEFKDFMFINLHEIAHICLMHPSRIGDKKAQLFNIACDLYVNSLLSEEFNIKPGQSTSDNLVRFPEDGYYCESLDLDKDYVEEIYEKLLSQADKNGYNDNKNKNGKYTFKFSGSGYGDDFEVTIDKESYTGDIINTYEDASVLENNNKKVLSEALTKCEMTNKDAGNTSGRLKFKVEEVLKSHVDWRKLLKKYCISILSKDTSFNNPDKRMFYQNAIYPGQSIDAENAIKGLKVCFDSSGSISNKDLAYFYGQVQDILSRFKVESELIYWDTAIESTGSFKDKNELMSVTAAGRGGTNPACIFRYFDSKKCKIKPVVTIIFTDGYIIDELNNPKWKRKYKDTIWVMTRDYNKTFNPPFGKKAIAKFN